MSDNLTNNLPDLRVQILNYLKDEGYIKKSDLDGMMQGVAESTIQNVLSHEKCSDSNCAVCKMKSGIHEEAFRKGVKGGIKVGQKYPKEKFEE